MEVRALFHVGGNVYELVKENKNGWNLEMFRNRYSEVLERYDYVVGDWGYNQLRLRGFYKENNPRMTKDSSIANLEDYINEYCNFGCAYFVLEKVGQSDRTAEEQGESAVGETPPPTNVFEGSTRMDRPDRYNRSGEPRQVKIVRPEKPVRERSDGARGGHGRDDRGGQSGGADRESRQNGDRVQWPDRKSARTDGDRPGRAPRGGQDRPDRGGRQDQRGGRNDSAARPNRGGDRPQQERQQQRHADRFDRGAAEHAAGDSAVRGERSDKRPPRRPNPERPSGESPAVAETSSTAERRPGPFRKRRHGGGHGPGHNASGEPGGANPRPPKQQRPPGPGTPPGSSH
ncbi:YutD-like domain-containing protein [Gorillibacterium sp. sgz500922]|uniref:YutD family protein n=1 Tax=Gorillibacterium sp. sgz500922 TaxID=3446694 RepID=UPI003F675A25